MKNLNIFPYYADHENQYEKKYKTVLFKPGKVLQARELIESQTLALMQNKETMDTLYKQGSIVSGCDITIDEENNKAILSNGQFYYDSRVLSVDEQNVDITCSGTEKLGLYVEETFVSASTDSELTDPASGYKNYGLDGADRLKIDVKLVKIIATPETKITLPTGQMYDDENNLTQIWDLLDGVVQNYVRKPDYSLLSQTLAKRTYDESGNYLVEGMKLDTEQSKDSDKIKVVVGAGICYVKGFDNTFIIPHSIEVNKALTTQDFLNEPHLFTTGTLSYELIKPYVVTDPLVKLITVTAVVRETINIARGSGDYDSFEDVYGTIYSSIESIIDIPGYVQGTDYELSADMIHWIGSKPSTSTNYEVTFRYYKNCIRDTDFELTKDAESDAYTIDWIITGDLPDNNTNFLVDYSTYMARTDLFSIDKFGNIIQKSGVDVNWNETLIPPFNSEMLPLGWIKFLPGKDYDSAIINEYTFKRTTMMELHRIKKRVSDLEQDVATLALEKETQEGELASSLTGIFVDPFTLLYKADTEHADYYASTNLIDGELQMVSDSIEIDFDRTSDSRVNITEWIDGLNIPKYLTCKKNSEQAFFTNTLKSDVMNLNPHGFIKLSPMAVLNPSGDSWINTQVVEKTIINNVVKNTATNIHQLQWAYNPDNTTQLEKSTIVNIGKTVGTEKVEIGNRLITYARQKTITVKGSNFEPASTLTATFGGMYVPLTAVSPYRNLYTGGTNTYKVIVASDGSFKATFTVPAGVKNGDIELTFTDEYSNSATVVYRSKGINKIIENRTTITSTAQKITDVYEIVSPVKTITTPVTPPAVISAPTPVAGGSSKAKMMESLHGENVTKDPLAQSFIFKEDKVLVAFDLFFATKADDNDKPVVEDDYYNTSAFQPTIPAILQIGYMKNGVPDAENIIYYQEIMPDEITTSLYGDTPTHITLKKPVFIPAMQDFFISIGSKSTEYTVYVSVLGQEDIVSGNKIMKQPYQDGVLFTSSNGITWTAEQDKDLTIVLYEGIYETSASFTTENIVFPQSGWSGFGRFMFAQDFNEIPGTNVQYYYSLDNGTTWVAFNPSDEINLAIACTQLKIKCELTSAQNIDDEYVLTPIINVDSNLIFFKYDISQINQYRMKSMENVPAYNNVKIILDENIPSGTACNKEFTCLSNSGGQVWFRLVHDPVEELDIGNGYLRRTFVFDFNLLQRLTVDTLTGFTVGDSLEIFGESTTRGKIVAVDTINNYIYVLLHNDTVTRFQSSDEITVDGVYTATVSAIYDYTSDPTWPEIFTGRLLMESSYYFKTPSLMNYRAIMKEY